MRNNVNKEIVIYRKDIRFHYIGTHLYIYCIILLNNYILKLKFTF